MSKRHLQHHIARRQQTDTAEADNWIREIGLNPHDYQSVDVRLLQAQRVAHTLLTEHTNLLDSLQRDTLESFQKRMSCQRSRRKLRPQAANAVLNIGSQINRKIFKEHRALIKAHSTGNRIGNH